MDRKINQIPEPAISPDRHFKVHKKKAKPAPSSGSFQQAVLGNEFDQWMHLSKFSTIPKTVRLPETIVFQLEYIAQQLKTHSGKLLTEMLEDILGAFMKDSGMPEITIIHHYRRLKEAGALRIVDAAELIEKIRLLSSNAES